MSNRLRDAHVMHWEPIGARDLAILAVAAAGCWLAAEFLMPRGVQVAVIPTLSMLAVRHFKHDKPGEHEPSIRPSSSFSLLGTNGAAHVLTERRESSFHADLEHVRIHSDLN